MEQERLDDYENGGLLSEWIVMGTHQLFFFFIVLNFKAIITVRYLPFAVASISGSGSNSNFCGGNYRKFSSN